MDFSLASVNDFDKQIICLFIIFTILIVYLLKKKINTYENTLFIALVVVDFLAVCVDVFNILSAYLFSTAVAALVCKISTLFIIFYMQLLTFYLAFTAMSEKSKRSFEQNKRSRIITWTLMSIAELIIFIRILSLDVTVMLIPGRIHHLGPAIDFVYKIVELYAVLWVIIAIVRWKHLKFKKIVGIIVYVLAGSVFTAFQRVYPEIVLDQFLMTFAVFVMYFTIDNPDLDLIEDLSLAKKQADDASMAKSEFLSNMSHEIRTPLNAILGFSQILSDANVDSETKGYIEEIHFSSKQLLHIVNSILDFSKMESKKFEMHETDYMLKKEIKQTIEEYKTEFEKKGIEFICTYDENIPKALYGDKNQIIQIINHLLSNALKFTNEGKVNLNLYSVMDNGLCDLMISVEDTGIGIEKEDVPKLFQKFEKLDSTKHLKIEGAGLGLAIIKHLTDMMEGEISVQSVYGQGSKFTILVKQKISNKDFALEIETSSKQDRDSFEGKRVLLVDDNSMNIKVAERLLVQYKLDVTSLLSGKECLNLINQKEKFDLIILDDMMPELSGPETLEKLKEIEGFDTKVVILTANSDNGMREQYLAKGFSDYLAKPINKNELGKVLNRNL